MIASTFVLAESFDAMPLELYDAVEAFTAPVLEPEYLDFTTCLHCDDSGVIEAVNQYHQDVLVPCPHCEGGKVEMYSREYYLTAHVSTFSCQRENSLRDEYLSEKLSRDNKVSTNVDSKPRFNMPAIYLTIYSQLEREGKLTIWEKKHRDSLLNAA